MDLLDAKWSGRLAKARSGYSGLILTATHAIAREPGWLERLATQRVMRCSPAWTHPGRWRSASGRCQGTVWTTSPLSTRTGASPSRSSIQRKARRSSIVRAPSSGLLPTQNAARLLQNWMCSLEGQQALVDSSGQYVPHTSAKPRPGRRPLAKIKAMRDDPAAVLEAAEAVKARYGAIFKV